MRIPEYIKKEISKMKKIKQIILTLLVVSFLVNPMYLILMVHATNEEIAMSRISDTLQSVMEISSEDEFIEVMIWLEDIDTSSAVLSSTDDILAVANATLSPRGLCENPETDAETYSQYMSARKEARRDYYEEYTQLLASSYLDSSEICFCSRYAPFIVAKLTTYRVIEVAKETNVVLVDTSAYNLSIDDTTLVDEYENGMYGFQNPGDGFIYYTMEEVKRIYGINSLISMASSYDDQIKIGVIDRGYPSLYNSLIKENVIEHYSSYAQETSFCHSAKILDILFSIIPNATFYYSNYDVAEDSEEGIYGEIEWLMDNDVHIITCSLPIYGVYNEFTDTHNEYGAVASYFDYLINEYSITFVKSSGNYPEWGISSGGTAYNVITVGNYNLGNMSIANDSSYYSGDVLALKPDVCAPGFIQFSNGTLDYGTSFSSPVIAGIAALIIASSGMIITPIMIKSIICASTQQHRYPIINEDGDINSNYRKYGAGVVDCWNIINIIAGDTVCYDFINADENTKTFYITINDSTNYGYADIVLVFEKYSFSNIDYQIANLDLFLYDFDGELVAYSNTTNNNIEVLRNIPVYDEPYTLVIRQITPATSTAGSSFTPFSYAWGYKE